jgi:hypothetical protein
VGAFLKSLKQLWMTAILMTLEIVNFAQQIATLQSDKGLSQEYVAEKVGELIQATTTI